MNTVINFIIEFKEYFVYGLVTLLTLIQLLVLIFKKKFINAHSIEEAILLKLPLYIIFAEDNLAFKNGSDKKKFVFNEMIKFVSEEYNLSSDLVINNFSKFINYHLEEILCTPQSKGGNLNG